MTHKLDTVQWSNFTSVDTFIEYTAVKLLKKFSLERMNYNINRFHTTCITGWVVSMYLLSTATVFLLLLRGR
jgi:hypothetical protein